MTERRISDGLIIYDPVEHNAQFKGEKESRGRIFWTREEAERVGKFLRREQTVVAESDDDFWRKIRANNEETSEEDYTKIASQVLSEAYPQGVPEKQDDVDGEEKLNQEEYEWSMKFGGKVALDIVGKSLRKHGLWSSEDYRRRGTESTERTGKRKTFRSDVKAPGYVHDSDGRPIVEENNLVLDPDYLHLRNSEGGVRVRSSISYPKFENGVDTSAKRLAAGLAHELAHDIRVFVNWKLWGLDEDRVPFDQMKLRQNVAAGGPVVGSNLQGSEAMGMLFASIIRAEWNRQKGGELTLAELQPILARKLQRRLTETGKDRYDMATLALFDHVRQLVEAGCGDVPTEDLLALGIMGFVTFEKMPDLIKGGIIKQNDWRNMTVVVREVRNFLVH